MSEKRARYNGPSGTGVDLTDVELVDGQIRAVHVPQGGQLPTDIGGVKVAASYRDGLLGQADWSLVRQPGRRKPKKAAAAAQVSEGSPPASGSDDGAQGAESTEE